jgi:uncharacterized membrane protein YfcA
MAGAVDAVVGGGGLIQIPALFVIHPGESAATLFGTNKCASVVGTANATWRNARQVVMSWRTILPAVSRHGWCLDCKIFLGYVQAFVILFRELK